MVALFHSFAPKHTENLRQIAIHGMSQANKSSSDMTATDQIIGKPPQERLGWVDAARGIAIILVVFGHAWRGVDAAGIIENEALYQRVDRFVYLFHMPVFFLLSGLFLPALIKAASFMTALGKQIVRLLYPMVLWTYVFLFMRYLAGDAANTTVTLADVFVIPLPPVEHMWFLWALFCIQIPLIGLLFVASKWRMRWEMPMVVFAITVLILAFMPLPQSLYPWFFNALEYAPFVALGWLATTQRPLPVVGKLQGLIAAAVFMALGILTPIPKGTHLFEFGLSAVMTLAFVLCIMALHRQVENTYLARWTRYLGGVSLTIFLMHTLFSAAVRAGLLAAEVNTLWLHMLLGTVAGVIIPALFDQLARRFNFAKALGF